MMYLTMAARNLRKNARRSLATLAAIAVGYLAVNLFSGYIGQSYVGLRESAIRGEGLGHLTLTKQGFLKEGTLHPDRYLFSRQEREAITDLLQRESVVDFVSPSLSASGLVSNGRTSTIFIAEGETPAMANRFKMPGSDRPALDEHRPGAGIVSKGLAEMLGSKPGETLVTLGTTLSGQTNALDLEVLGLWDTHMAATNDKTLKLPLEYLQKLMDTDGVSRLVVMLKGKADADQARRMLLPKLRQAGFEVEIQTWVERSAFYRQVKTLFDLIFLFLTAIVAIVVLMSILNTLSMSVMERVREIGTLRALGLQRWGIIRLFALEGGLLGLAGSLIGALATLGLTGGINAAGIQWLPPSVSTPVTFRLAYMPGVMVGCVGVLAVVAIFAAFWPARRAARVEIVDALGHV